MEDDTEMKKGERASAIDWGQRARAGFLASGIDPADSRGHKNRYIDLLHKAALEEVLELTGDELVLDFGSGSGRISHWIAPRIRKVVGLEVTPAMIDLAEKSRVCENVEFILYDGMDFPLIPYLFDLILSIGVLQIMEGEKLLHTLSALSHYLKPDGRVLLIEQVSGNPERKRPSLKYYLQAFEAAGLDCLRYYPVRKGRWWLLYLIRYGVIPDRWLPRVASLELRRLRGREETPSCYNDYLFVAKKR